MRHWFFLCIAIAAEVAGTSFMKWSSDSGHMGGLLAMFVLLALSYYALSLAVTRVPMGLAYAIWEGVGLVAISLISLAVFDESISLGKALGIATVLLGILVLKRGMGAEKASSAKPVSGGAPARLLAAAERA